jgi:hypothetical protein
MRHSIMAVGKRCTTTHIGGGRGSFYNARHDSASFGSVMGDATLCYGHASHMVQFSVPPVDGREAAWHI